MDIDAGGGKKHESRGRWGGQDGLQPVNNKWIFCLSPSLIRCGSIHLLCHHYLSPIPPMYQADLLSTLSFPFFPFPFWISSPLCALFPSPGMADRDPWVRPAGRGRHAAGQQGETLLPTLGDGWTDGLIEGGRDHGGSWSVRTDFRMSGSRGRMYFMCIADWILKCPTCLGIV